MIRAAHSIRIALATLPLVLALLLVLPARPTSAALTTVRVASGILRPVFVTAPEGDDRLFVVEQWGRIWIVKDGAVLPRPFLDIDSEVGNIPGQFDERGLLGLAFHPDYAANGKFYVYYIDNQNDSRIVEHYVSGDPDSAIVDSFRTVVETNQPYGNHKGGTLAFRPTDGYLYFCFGDGGSGGDPEDRAQHPDTLLGKLIRIDVDSGDPYGIPPDNPFVGGPGADEIWSLGFRNPYRWSFDRLTGDLYVGDVGQGCWEEVSFEPAAGPGGQNHGWDVMEGAHCFNELDFNDCDNLPCTGDTLVLPIHEYPSSGTRCAVTGGYVYRGDAIPSLQGTYFFADFCADSIWSFRYDGATLSDFQDRTLELAPGGGLAIADISAFGEDGHGELYIVDRSDGLSATGEIYKIVDEGAISVPPPGPPSAPRLALGPPRPNPGTGSVRCEVSLAGEGRLVAEVTDAAGRLVRRLHDGPAGPGTRTLEWDGRDESGRVAPPGVYFLRAALGGEVAARTVTRLRP